MDTYILSVLQAFTVQLTHLYYDIGDMVITRITNAVVFQLNRVIKQMATMKYWHGMVKLGLAIILMMEIMAVKSTTPMHLSLSRARFVFITSLVSLQQSWSTSLANMHLWVIYRKYSPLYLSMDMKDHSNNTSLSFFVNYSHLLTLLKSFSIFGTWHNIMIIRAEQKTE